MRLKQQLLAVCDAYATAEGLSEARVSKIVFGAGNRIKALRPKGKGMISGNIEDALEKLSALWPEGVAWPCEVPRPAPPPSGD